MEKGMAVLTTYQAYTGRQSHGTWVKKGESKGPTKRRTSKGLRWVGFWTLGALAFFTIWNGIASANTKTVSYRVNSHDTLWSIATKINPSEDPRAIVQKIEGMNHLPENDAIYPGEVIQVPRT